LPVWLGNPESSKRKSELVGVVSAVTFGWLLVFDAPSAFAQLLIGPTMAAEWSMQGLVGGVPREKVLLFLTLVACFLLYGVVLSGRIQERMAQRSADACVFLIACLAFAACLNDSASLVLLCSLVLAYQLVSLLLMKRGTLKCRVALLIAGHLLVAGGLWLLGAFELCLVMAFALLVVLFREVVHNAARCVQQALRRRRLASAGSVCSDALLPPLLLDALSQDAFGAHATAQELVTAACVAAGARASLKEQQPMSSTIRAMDTTAWAPWTNLSQAGRCGSPECGVSFELNQVSYHVGPDRKLLKELTLDIPAGAIVAVMGASGSGKTTLLSVLSGRCGDGRLSGNLRLNGIPKMPWQMATLRPLWGYVPQDDVMHTSLTVSENIRFQARLRLASKSEQGVDMATTTRQSDSDLVSRRVEAVVEGLGLAATRDRIVKDGLSGGQRKRVSIGMEVVAQPRVLMLDEPTTGLDSATAHRIVELVAKDAREKQCTTFATIHQPRWNTLGLFDMIVLLAPGGHLCYAGPVAAVKAYFEEVLHIDFPEDENPADIFIDTCTFESARRMALDSVWRSPPQCLRAVLFPTPEAASAQDREGSMWQADEFGRMLAALWSDFSSRRARLASEAAAPVLGVSSFLPSLPSEASIDSLASAKASGFEASALLGSASSECRLEVEAAIRMETAHWSQQVQVHLVRALLIYSRQASTLALHTVLLILAMVSLGTAIPEARFFLKTALLILLYALVQSVAAQRLFGGEERHVAWREASVSSLSQVVFAFVGKDVASLLEISLMSAVFVFAYWPYAGSYASAFDMYEVGFATAYAFWGFNHILAICFPPASAMLLAVIYAFVSFVFSGLRPPASVVAPALGGYGKVLLLASPLRWALTNWLFHHIEGATLFLTVPAKAAMEMRFRERGFSLDDLPTPPNRNIGERWAQESGWVTHCGQLFLLGFLFRFLAVTCLLVTSSANASGGQLSLGELSMAKLRIMKSSLLIFLVFFSIMCILLLGRTW